MIVLDASVLIAYGYPPDVHHASARSLLREHGEDEFAAAAISLAEYLVGPVRSGTLAAAKATLTDLDVRQLDLPSDAPIRLAELRTVTGLKLPDCCVLLAAQDEGAAVATFDDRLRQATLDLNLPLA